MKTLTMIAAVFLVLPLGSALADEVKPVDPVEACHGRSGYLYNFDMMKIERDEMDRKISHDTASELKLKRHEKFLEESEDCKDAKKE